MKPSMFVTILITATALSACSVPVKLDAGNPVALASCPAVLPPLVNDTFGATVEKLVEVSGIYFKCRAAAVGEK